VRSDDSYALREQRARVLRSARWPLLCMRRASVRLKTTARVAHLGITQNDAVIPAVWGAVSVTLHFCASRPPATPLFAKQEEAEGAGGK
jgi:hypothetical protein